MNPKVIFDDLPWQSPLPGLRFKAFVAGGKKLRLAEFYRELVEPDWCRKEHFGYLLEGVMEIDFQGRVETYRAGDGIFIPADTPHMARVPEGKAVCFFVEPAV